MRAALVVYGSLSSISGGYLYDRMLVSKMRLRGDEVQVISQPRRGYAASLLDNLQASFSDVDVVIQDELNHPSVFLANRRRPHPHIVSIVHHLRSSERRPAWQNGVYAAVERAYLQGVDGFIFNSDTTRESVHLLAGARKPYVVATPGGDRLGTLAADDVRRRVARRGHLRLVSVGSAIPGKGLDILLDAMRQIRDEAVQLDIVGPVNAAPSFAARLRSRAAELGLPIRFHGELSDSELQRCMQAADVFVLPSYYEGFGIVFLEGMAQGLPAIGAAAGAVPSLIRDGSNGFLVAPGDAGKLAGCIRTLARDRELLLEMSLRALRSAGTFPTWDQSTEKMREFLKVMAGIS